MRQFYSPFEAEIRSGTSDVYRHEMPGGQYTNLREQARSMGQEHRWNEVAQTYWSRCWCIRGIDRVEPKDLLVELG